MHCFITGTDTDVGKTYVACLLIRALRQAGIDAVGMKPIACGDRADAEALHAACEGAAELNAINPVWLRTPAAPYAAAMIEERSIDLDLIRETFSKLKQAHEAVVIEGAGGWMVPITRDYFVRDLAREFAAPVFVVAANRLGALNHARLTVEAVRAAGLSCLGTIWNDVLAVSHSDTAAATNQAVFESLAGGSISIGVAHGQAELHSTAADSLMSALRQC